MMRSVAVDGMTVEYEWFAKGVKNINLRVERDGTVRVSAPKTMKPEQVDDFVRRNIDFIRKVRQKYAALPKKESGVVYYFGKRYEYVVRKGERDRVMMEEGKLILETIKPGDEMYEKLVLSVYEEEMCKRLFPDVVQRLMPLVEPFGVEMPVVTPRRMTTRWGSCTMARGAIRLNTELIHYPMECIEQVALHELCHFVHGNHSKDFYALLTRLMPDWREREKLLEKGMFKA